MMDQWLEALAALAETPSLTPSISMVVPIHNSREFNAPSDIRDHYTCCGALLTCRQDIHKVNKCVIHIFMVFILCV